jgi:protein-disulfide isomerase
MDVENTNVEEVASSCNKDSCKGSFSDMTEKVRANPWILSTLVLGVFVLVLVIPAMNLTGNTVSSDDAGDSVLDFVKTQTDGEGELVQVNDMGDSLYEVMILYQGQEIPLYVTKDGENLVQGVMPLVDTVEPTPTIQEGEVVKSDLPVVELFVMTHCPYGTQAEKGFIPFMEAMGDSVDAKIRFVHYFMHDPEETETPRQVCIREEQSDKYLTYLSAFLEEGDYEYALDKAGIDVDAMEECISNGNAEEYYTEDSELSESYGVGGSPTLVVNGVIASSGRSASAYLETTCSAFNDAPNECSLELDSTSPSPMWGWDASSAETTAQC